MFLLFFLLVVAHGMVKPLLACETSVSYGSNTCVITESVPVCVFFKDLPVSLVPGVPLDLHRCVIIDKDGILTRQTIEIARTKDVSLDTLLAKIAHKHTPVACGLYSKNESFIRVLLEYGVNFNKPIMLMQLFSYHDCNSFSSIGTILKEIKLHCNVSPEAIAVAQGVIQQRYRNEKCKKQALEILQTYKE